jgi:hypothetical protein
MLIDSLKVRFVQYTFIAPTEARKFPSLQMQTLSEDNLKLVRVFELVKALVDNKHLYLEPYVSTVQHKNTNLTTCV